MNYNSIVQHCQQHLRQHARQERTQRVSKCQDLGRWNTRRRGHAQPIAVDLADRGPPSARKTHGSTVQKTMSPIPGMVSYGSLKKWLKHDGVSVLDFKRSFLSPPLSPILETIKYQLVSSKALIWYIVCLCFVTFTKKSHFSKLTIKNVSLSLPCFACRANQDS